MDESRRPHAALVPFFTVFMLFVGAMLGIVLSMDLLLFFVFWDVTAICSYLLIAFDRHDAESRRAALMALLVTGISSILLLAAALLLLHGYGTTDVRAVLRAARPDRLTAAACTLLVIAALGKSAQWPLHFWLPRAMAAPTPVSAYLHAAAMVAAGVFLLQRVQPLLHQVAGAGTALVALGWLSMAGAGLLALREDEMKRILAYSTIAQYGHVVFLVGVGGAHAAAAAAFFVVAHGLCKSALFLTVGAVTAATGKHALSDIGGLLVRMPLLGISAAIAAAGLAGVPLTVGFFKDEALFATAAGHGWGLLALAVSGPMLTIAYIWRFWSGIFLGRRRIEHPHHSFALVGPIALSAVLILALGVFAEPLGRIAERAAADVVGDASLSTSYHLDARPSNIAALAAFAGAALVTLLLRSGGRRALDALARVPGPARAYYGTAAVLHAGGRAARRYAPHSLRGRVTVVFVSTLVLVLAGQIAVGMTLPDPGWQVSDTPAIAALALTAVAGIATVSQRRHIPSILALSVTTMGLAIVFAVIGAPDVALVIVIINVITTVLLVALLHRLPPRVVEEQRTAPSLRRWAGEDGLLAASAGLLAFLVTSGTLGSSEPGSWIGRVLVAEAHSAHASNVVTAVLADFRGLDTLGEITVVAISVLAVDTFMRRRGGEE